MVTINVPYIRERPNRNGTNRLYWIRPGFKVVRLPDDMGEAIQVAMRLNSNARRAPARRKARPIRAVDDPNRFAYWIEQYRKSEAFYALAASSRKNYGFSLNRLEDVLGEAQIEGITTLVVRRFLAEHEPTPQVKIRARAVISNVMSLAIDGGMIATNPVRDVRLKTPKSRKAIYTDDDIAVNLEAIEKEPPERRHWLRMAFMLELYTAQRIGDCLAMKWGAFDGEFLNVVQEKTGKTVEIYTHKVLRDELEMAKASRTGLNIVQRPNGMPVTYQSFAVNMRRIRKSAGLAHLNNHDIRRTAATRLAEAGNSIPVIAAVTGHSERYVQTLCEVYIQKTRRMTKAAILKLEEFEKVNANVNAVVNAKVTL